MWVKTYVLNKSFNFTQNMNNQKSRSNSERDFLFIEYATRLATVLLSRHSQVYASLLTLCPPIPRKIRMLCGLNR